MREPVAAVALCVSGWFEFRRVENITLKHSWLSRAGSEDFAIAALRQILEWKVENIRPTLSVLTELIAKGAAKLGCTSLPASDRVNHMIGVRLPNGIPAGVSERMVEAKVFVSVLGDAIRIAPHLYNGESDIEKFSPSCES